MSLELRELHKRFGQIHAVNDLSFTAHAGEIFGLIGHNGAGKTTTFRMILDLLEPDSGEMLWEGQKTAALDKRRVGFLPEERGLYPKSKLGEQLMFFAELKGMSRKESRPEIERWLEHFGLADRSRAKAETLSKGMQQKAQIIMAIAHKPELLILDEPFTGLDPVNADLFKKVILDLKDEGTTIIFSSHRMDHVEELCDAICMLKDGEAAYSGSLLDLKKQYGRIRLTIAPEWTAREAGTWPGVTQAVAGKGETRLYLDSPDRARDIFTKVAGDGYTDVFKLDYLTMEEIFKLINTGSINGEKADEAGVRMNGGQA